MLSGNGSGGRAPGTSCWPRARARAARAGQAGVVGPGDPAAFARFIGEGYFEYVALNFTDTVALDHGILADMRKEGYYKIVSVVPYGPRGGTYVIYRYEPRL